MGSRWAAGEIAFCSRDKPTQHTHCPSLIAEIIIASWEVRCTGSVCPNVWGYDSFGFIGLHSKRYRSWLSKKQQKQQTTVWMSEEGMDRKHRE